ncbi:hypothetical protein [Streptomyces griseoluteus]|uniref:hypothetical protein n=1 Tax=Streptomyces griseoluteus TaxID=29306 RepID=UPI00357107C0
MRPGRLRQRELGGDRQRQRLRPAAGARFGRPGPHRRPGHHFTVPRAAGLVEQRDEGARRVNRLRRAEFEARFPGLLDLVLRGD